MRRLLILVLSVLAAAGLAPFVPLAAPPAAAGERACFEGTKYCAENAFLVYWKRHGGLEILGLPVSQPFVDDRGLIVQFYERAIMEWHPENGADYRVLLTLLGSDRLGSRPERNTPPKPCEPPACAYLAETRHTLRGAFLKYWQTYGGLPVFGFPLTEEFVEVNPSDGKPYLVQYFERNRFELHPEYAGSRYEVLLGLLGAETLRGRPAVLARPAVQVPDYPRTVGVPLRLAIPAIGVDAAVEAVGVDANNTMETPRDPWSTAWFQYGPRPGEPGNAVVAGHVDYADIGPVVFWEVRLLPPGAEVWVTDEAGARRRFVVQGVESYLLDQFPADRVFGPADDANLNLISCVGDFDPVSRSYNQRVVIYARWDGVVR